jgi:hypothetical protein
VRKQAFGDISGENTSLVRIALTPPGVADIVDLSHCQPCLNLEGQRMDNLNSNPNGAVPDEPIPIGDDLEEPIPFDDGSSSGGQVSHAPLDLGGGPAVPVPKKAPAKPTLPTAHGVSHPVQKTNVRAVSTQDIAAGGGRITGVKTFFAKLHAGSLEFLDGQIADWLRDNPDVVVKYTNIATGDVVAKKTEPNILITLWY